jgi:hypothetical protein
VAGARLIADYREVVIAASAPRTDSATEFDFLGFHVRKVRKVGKVPSIMTTPPFLTFLTFLALVPRKKATG